MRLGCAQKGPGVRFDLGFGQFAHDFRTTKPRVPDP